MQSGVVKLLSFFLVLIGGGLYFLSISGQNHSMTDIIAVPCHEPDTFRIGEIDDRYMIDEHELYLLLREVADVWSEAFGRPVMEFDNDGEIRINLIYAEQQELSDQERQFRDRIQSERYRIASVEKEYEQMDREYRQRVEEHQQNLTELQQMIEDLNNWVAQKNEEGGFRESEMPLFEQRKHEVDSLSAALNRHGHRLNETARILNQKVDRINEKVADKNRLVDEYNRTFTGTRRFTQGSYERRGNDRSINVFSFLDEDELKLVLAHEMGHALGIGHVENPGSVMYHLMGNQARPGVELTDEDRRALLNICGNEFSSN
jgi:hypothetical protein